MDASRCRADAAVPPPRAAGPRSACGAGVRPAARLHIGIAGAGLLGRLLACTLARSGARVSVFDPAGGPEPRFDGRSAAGFSATGLLAVPEGARTRLAALGARSLLRWQAIAAELPERPRVARCGCWLVALAGPGRAGRRPDRPGPRAAPPLGAAQLAALEPRLRGAAQAWLRPDAACLDPVAVLRALYLDAAAVQWYWGCRVVEVQAGALRLDGTRHGWRGYDAVFDVRGLGACDALPLRGVRSETVWLGLAGHGLARPVRLLDARGRIELVPRGGDQLVLGGAGHDSEDRAEVGLGSALALMAVARRLMPALGDARILRLDRSLQAALPDGLPHVEVRPGLVRINGLSPHAWLLAPALVEEALTAWRDARAAT